MLTGVAVGAIDDVRLSHLLKIGELDLVQVKSNRAFHQVTAFVDWNSQLLINGVDYEKDPLSAARTTLKRTAKRIASGLSTFEPDGNFQVSLRLYHGWHKGYQPSENRRAVKQVLVETDFATLSERPNVVFSPEVGFGDCLLSALPRRIHAALSIHLANTLRERVRGKGHEEKMVDTALASDVMVAAYQDPGDWILVAAEDDDLVPPIFAAEAILAKQGSHVLLLRNRRQSKNFLKLDDILLAEKK